MRRLRLYSMPYIMQLHNAKKRGIEFKLTYREWLHIWLASGHINERGKRADQYCMARIGDQGAYEVGNVEIKTNRANAQENWKRRTQSSAERAKRAATITAWWAAGRPHRRRGRPAA